MDIIEVHEWLYQLLAGASMGTGLIEVEAVPNVEEMNHIEIVVVGSAFPKGKRFRILIEEA